MPVNIFVVCHSASLHCEPVIEKLFIVGHPRHKVENLVVRNRVRPDDLLGEFIDAPSQDKVSDRDEVEDNRPEDRQDYS